MANPKRTAREIAEEVFRDWISKDIIYVNEQISEWSFNPRDGYTKFTRADIDKPEPKTKKRITNELDEDDSALDFLNESEGKKEDVVCSMEFIICPQCNSEQEATIIHTSPFNTMIHHCSKCNYVITESDWRKAPEKKEDQKEKPDKIYLTESFKDDVVYWVRERESDNDVEYVRADIVAEQAALIEHQGKEIEELKAVDIIHLEKDCS